MCLITSPRENREYVKETYVSPRPARPTSQVYAYRDGTYSREYTTPVSPAVIRSEYARSDYAPSMRSHRSHRSHKSSSSRRSSSYLTAVPAGGGGHTTATTTRHVYPALTHTTDLVPVARTETMYVTEEVTPPRSVVYTTGRVSPAVVMEDHRRRSQMYY